MSQLWSLYIQHALRHETWMFKKNNLGTYMWVLEGVIYIGCCLLQITCILAPYMMMGWMYPYLFGLPYNFMILFFRRRKKMHLKFVFRLVLWSLVGKMGKFGFDFFLSLWSWSDECNFVDIVPQVCTLEVSLSVYPFVSLPFLIPLTPPLSFDITPFWDLISLIEFRLISN